MMNVFKTIKDFLFENIEYCDAVINIMNGGDYYTSF